MRNRVALVKGSKERDMVNAAIKAVRAEGGGRWLSAHGILRIAGWRLWASNGGRYEPTKTNAVLAVDRAVDLNGRNSFR